MDLVRRDPRKDREMLLEDGGQGAVPGEIQVVLCKEMGKQTFSTPYTTLYIHTYIHTEAI